MLALPYHPETSTSGEANTFLLPLMWHVAQPSGGHPLPPAEILEFPTYGSHREERRYDDGSCPVRTFKRCPSKSRLVPIMLHILQNGKLKLGEGDQFGTAVLEKNGPKAPCSFGLCFNHDPTPQATPFTSQGAPLRFFSERCDLQRQG